MLANGNVAVQYGVLAGGFQGTDQTVKLMQDMSQGQYGSRSTKIRAFALNIINEARIPEKDEYREMLAIHNWVRDHIRYQKDVHGQETLSHPEELLFNTRAGDCDDKSMLEAALLSSVGIPTRFKTVGLTPMQFSHVYLEAHPRGSKWIPLDPIMKNRPAGWEVPKSKQKLVKIYSENRPTGDSPMNGLGYVSEHEGSSHLGVPTQGDSPYVKMTSFLDTDLPIEQISQQLPANPPNANIPQQFPRQRMQAARRDPMLYKSGGNPLPAASRGAIEAHTMGPGNQMNGVMGPDALAGLAGGNGGGTSVEGVHGVGSTDNGYEGADVVQMPRQGNATPYMQSQTVAHAPQGVDEMFTRPHLIHKPGKGDRIEYHGHRDMSERPPIRAETGMAGYAAAGDHLPGMGTYISNGSVGPGLAQADDPGAAPVAVAPQPNQTLKYVGFGLLVFGIYKFATKKKRA